MSFFFGLKANSAAEFAGIEFIGCMNAGGFFEGAARV